jgi:hypothetical protein
MRRSCENCDFWSVLENDPDIGECRFNPPVVNLEDKVIVCYVGDEINWKAFPITANICWCGKFYAKE